MILNGKELANFVHIPNETITSAKLDRDIKKTNPAPVIQSNEYIVLGVNEKAFDGRGNYTLGITEQIIFPEINIDKINKIGGMDITFVTTAKKDEEAHALLSKLGIAFRKK